VMQLKCHAPVGAPRRMNRTPGSAVTQDEGTIRPSWAGPKGVGIVVPRACNYSGPGYRQAPRTVASCPPAVEHAR
jgi:hypothetical protein